MNLFGLEQSLTQHKAPQLMLTHRGFTFSLSEVYIQSADLHLDVRGGSSKWCHAVSVPVLSYYGTIFLQPSVMTLMEKHTLQAAEILASIPERGDRCLISNINPPAHQERSVVVMSSCLLNHIVP